MQQEVPLERKEQTLVVVWGGRETEEREEMEAEKPTGRFQWAENHGRLKAQQVWRVLKQWVLGLGDLHVCHLINCMDVC